jgi:membrane associated rhomboid family serine protease
MIPLRDDIAGRRAPVVTVGLIALNVAVFLYQVSLGTGGPAGARAAEEFVYEFGAVPCRIAGSCATPDDFPPLLGIVTSMFLHGGFVHIAGNMLYLWIFGDNVEDTLGRLRYLVFYLVVGAAAATAQTLMSPASDVPMVGASGAVSGVLGAYLLLFPYARILTLVTFGFFVRFIYIPAIVMLGFWIVVQVVSGLLTFGAVAGGGGGVAWFAHIGGFMAGMALVFVFRPRGTARL